MAAAAKRRRRNFLFAFFCPIGCRAAASPSSAAVAAAGRPTPRSLLAGSWPGWPSSASLSLPR